VKGLRLEIVRGVAVAVVVEPPAGLDAADRHKWDIAISRASALLRPAALEGAGTIVTAPWLRESWRAARCAEGWRFEFAPIASTHDAVAIVRLQGGELLATIAIDAAIERAPWRVAAPLPADATDEPFLFLHSEWVAIELRAPDGSAVANVPVVARLQPGTLGSSGPTRSDRDGRLPMEHPAQNHAIELRVAGYESAWLFANPAAPPGATTPDAQTTDPLATPPLVVTLRPLPRAR
jgi:hypothetical protein